MMYDGFFGVMNWFVL